MARRSKITALLRRLVLSSARHAGAARIILVVLLILSTIAVIFGSFSSDISRMLPDGSVSAETYRAVSRCGMFNKAVIVFYLPQGKTFADSSISLYIEKLAPKLEALPLVESVDFRFSGNIADSMRELAGYIPQLVPFPSSSAERAANNVYRQLLTPGGIGRTEMLRLDPFGELGKFLGKLEQFRSISGMNISPKYPYLVSADETAAMMMIESPVSVSDSANSAKLLDSIHSVLSDIPDGITYNIISGHRRAVCNETVLRSDIKIVCYVSTILFALLFIVFYRCDYRSFLIPLIPVLASTIVLAVMTLIFRETLFFVIGMGGIVISLAVDYGIHTYAAMTGKGKFLRLLRLIPALCLGALTSVIAFGLFLTSNTEGCRQLGFFAGGSLLLSLLMMLIFLPAFLAKGKRIELRFHAPEFSPRLLIVLWGIILLTSLVLLPRLQMNSDVRQFDVSPPEFAQEEGKQSAKFMSGKRPAIFLVQGNSREEMERKLESTVSVLRIKAELPMFSALDLYPSEQIRKKNLDEWKLRRTDKDLEILRRRLAASPLGPEFFKPFFDEVNRGIDNPPSEPPAFFAPVLKRLTVEKNGLFTSAVFFPDTPENITRVRSLTRHPIVSQDGLAKQMSSDVMRGILPLGVIALCCVILLTLLYFRSIRDSLLALLPVVTSLIVTAGVFSAIGIRINLSVLIAAIILCGLAVDYGIFVLHALKQSGKLEHDVFNAVTLSAVTSAAGGATVVFTTHPMLRDAGLTLIIGITAAWASGVFVIPALKKSSLPRTVLPLLLCVFLCSCASDPFTYEMPEKIPVVAPVVFTQEASIVMEYPFFKISALGLVRVNRGSGEIGVVGLSPAGMKIFDISGTEEKLANFWLIPSEQWKGREKDTAHAILNDIASVYLYNDPDSGSEMSRDGTEETYESELGVWVFRDSVLREKKVFRKGKTVARVRFFAYNGGIPSKVVLDNRKYGYRLIIRAIGKDEKK